MQKILTLVLFTICNIVINQRIIGQELQKDGRRVILKNCTTINTSSLDFSPAFYQNGIIYVSSVPKGNKIDKNIGEPFFDLLYAQIGNDGMPVAPQDFSVEINSQFHEGPVSFSRDDNKLYFSQSNQKNGISKAGKKNKVQQKIYEATRGKKNWENVKELPFNNDNYSAFHPTLSPDGKKLYFASDMPGGFGKMDIWVSEKNGDKWAAPVNLGAKINTAQDEAFPFMHESGFLFFATNGRPGFGLFDLFMINLEDDELGAINMGAPFNSNKDDFGLILNPEGTRGYLTTNRDGGIGEDDIYAFDIIDGIEDNKGESIGTIAVTDAQTQQRLQGVSLYVFELSASGISTNNKLYDVVLENKQQGASEMIVKLIRKSNTQLGTPDRYTTAEGEATYNFKKERKYTLLALKEGYQSVEFAYSTEGKKNDTLRINIPILKKTTCLDVTGNVTNALNNSILPNTTIVITNIATKEAINLKTNEKGLFNACIDPGATYTISAQKENFSSQTQNINLPQGDNIKVNSISIGLTPTSPPTPIATPAPKVESVKTTEPPIKPIDPVSINPTTKIEQGAVIILDKIYYDFDKSNIRKGATQELDALATIMRAHSSMEIELVSHTDSRGNAAYNQKLSSLRAESARQYLIAQGIAHARIRTRGAGESELRNHCSDGVNCSEEEHQFNRRTEVKVIKIDEAVKVEYKNN